MFDIEKSLEILHQEIKTMKGIVRKVPHAAIVSIWDADKELSFESIAELNLSFPDFLIQFYKTFASLTIKWMYIDPTNPCDIITANSQIPLLRILLKPILENPQSKNKFKDKLWTKKSEQSLINTLESTFLILDDLGFDNFILIKQRYKKNETYIYFYSYPNKLIPTILTFEEYVKNTILYKGMHLWQIYFLKEHKSVLDLFKFFDLKRNIDKLFPKNKISIPEVSFTEENKYKYRYYCKRKDYVDKLNNLKEYLKKKVGRKNISVKINPGTSDLELFKTSVAIGRDLPDSMLTFYRQVNGFEIDWIYSIPDSIIKENKIDPHYQSFGARFKILPLSQVFGGFNSKRDWDDDIFKNVFYSEEIHTQEEIQLFKQFRLLSSQEYNDTVIRLLPNQDEPELRVIDENDFIPLNISFSEYLECIFENGGIDYWQRFVTDSKEYPDNEFLNLPPFIKLMKILFPKSPLDKYRNPSIS